MPPLYLLIKPASSLCDMRCRYCFYCDVAQNRRESSYGLMEPATLEAVIQKALLAAEGECTFAYQGGEPTLAGLDFFKRSIELEKKHNVKGLKLHHLIQTNGFRLTEEWARFFHENRFLVGVSLDGTRATHNAFRRDPRDGPTFQAVMDSIALLRAHKVDFNILTVVHSQTARHAGQIYEFYKREGFSYLQFIPCLPPFGKEQERFPHTLTPKAYGRFLQELFTLWERDVLAGREVHIRQFENYIEMLLGWPPESCGMSGVCSVQHVIEATGEVYPCDFYVTDPYRLGDLRTDSFADLEENRRRLRFIEGSRALPEKCRACRFLPICRGGCRRYREPFTDGRQLNIFCPSYEAFFQAALPRLQRLARIFSQPPLP